MTIKRETDIRVEITSTCLTEFASLSNLSPTEIAELVEIGVLIPSGVSPKDWAFNDQTLMLMRRLRRLEADFELELDLKTLALGYRLLERIEELESHLEKARVHAGLSAEDMAS
ncbi:MAG: chaperone modulatory protein CbpM [Gammaproteobacteria bacterium]|nr:chaperone modulatory protein CbpM [Gammaproteobacteria bacterium]NBT44989.1 chaperone modulatory protein CbpM [Gammaproteobacteria bacterium]NBY23114.1 chaperone modulatory protein CbpM [Gammaproteobacteria bacterium]NDE33474.1 chaperone modulatory protein CbpM [Gammaproteobacteria bacterium]NDE55582.1 chaperone modulatory protein CbpM [Gammaproteobacteria bacterium]